MKFGSWQSSKTYLFHHASRRTTTWSVACVRERLIRYQQPSSPDDETRSNVKKPPSVQEFIEDQSTDVFCKLVVDSVGKSGS